MLYEIIAIDVICNLIFFSWLLVLAWLTDKSSQRAIATLL